MHVLYIIYSRKLDKFYSGETTNLKHRLDLHNNHSFKKAYTKAANDWKVKLNFSNPKSQQPIRFYQDLYMNALP
ncbi:MAG: GIY-YIG nuclease family protein [Flavobacteriaceae bacterium]